MHQLPITPHQAASHQPQPELEEVQARATMEDRQHDLEAYQFEHNLQHSQEKFAPFPPATPSWSRISSSPRKPVSASSINIHVPVTDEEVDAAVAKLRAHLRANRANTTPDMWQQVVGFASQHLATSAAASGAASQHHLKASTQQHQPRKEELVKVRQIFNKYDVDGSNAIDREELKHICYELNVLLTDEDQQEAFAVLDADHSGVVDFNEFTRWFFDPNLKASGSMLLRGKLMAAWGMKELSLTYAAANESARLFLDNLETVAVRHGQALSGLLMRDGTTVDVETQLNIGTASPGLLPCQMAFRVDSTGPSAAAWANLQPSLPDGTQTVLLLSFAVRDEAKAKELAKTIDALIEELLDGNPMVAMMLPGFKGKSVDVVPMYPRAESEGADGTGTFADFELRIAAYLSADVSAMADACVPVPGVKVTEILSHFSAGVANGTSFEQMLEGKLPWSSLASEFQVFTALQCKRSTALNLYKLGLSANKGSNLSAFIQRKAGGWMDEERATLAADMVMKFAETLQNARTELHFASLQDFVEYLPFFVTKIFHSGGGAGASASASASAGASSSGMGASATSRHEKKTLYEGLLKSTPNDLMELLALIQISLGGVDGFEKLNRSSEVMGKFFSAARGLRAALSGPEFIGVCCPKKRVGYSCSNLGLFDLLPTEEVLAASPTMELVPQWQADDVVEAEERLLSALQHFRIRHPSMTKASASGANPLIHYFITITPSFGQDQIWAASGSKDLVGGTKRAGALA
eukprot:g1158.t1